MFECYNTIHYSECIKQPDGTFKNQFSIKKCGYQFKTDEEHKTWHKHMQESHERAMKRYSGEIQFIIDTIDNNTSEEAAEIIRNASPEGSWNI